MVSILTNTLASHHRNRFAPAQDRTRPISPAKWGHPLQQHNIFIQRSPQPHSPRPDTTLRYSRPPTLELAFPSLSEWPQTPRPVYPTGIPQAPLILLLGSYSEEWSLIGLPTRPFLPEDIYLGCTVPTRNKDELNRFRTHCAYLLQHHLDYRIDHLLMDIFCICPHPIVFAGFLWRYRTTITSEGILEDYWVVTTHTDSSDSVLLKRAYTMFYSWSEYSYTTSIVWAIGKDLKKDI
jgi:hypothetical protein